MFLYVDIFGRSFCPENSEYNKNSVSTKSLLSMSFSAGCNGTVAIIFVSLAESKGFIPYDVAAQLKLGFLLTIIPSFLGNWIINLMSKTEKKSYLSEIFFISQNKQHLSPRLTP